MRISRNLHPIATKRNTFNYDMEIGLYRDDGLAVLVHPPPRHPPPPPKKKLKGLKKKSAKCLPKTTYASPSK